MILVFRLLSFFSIEQIYETLEIVFHRPSKHLEFRRKYSPARRFFELSSRCLDIPIKHCLLCLIYYSNDSFVVFLHWRALLAYNYALKWFLHNTTI